ncbi:hypothetical protein [Kitasatospora sp. NBC_01302]|uniref:hypothetical protein n=1 Tax=Kitasatospora sp. NBC_01302 TaxID=2903575 RepID=UPI002E149AE5|nr:hypothetical protein OG294_09715 [Kitasatospora sp. NBC_01302]
MAAEDPALRAALPPALSSRLPEAVAADARSALVNFLERLDLSAAGQWTSDRQQCEVLAIA